MDTMGFVTGALLSSYVSIVILVIRSMISIDKHLRNRRPQPRRLALKETGSTRVL